LFPEAPARPLTWGRVGLAAVALLVAAGIGLLRQPGAGALNTVWAEDGSIFLSQATGRGVLHALVTSYGGYYHLVPRLLAGLASLAPASAAAAILATSAALCVAGVAILVYVASAGHFTSPVARVLVAAVVVAVPVGQDEVLNSIANLHWYGLYALFWMLVWVPRSRSARVVSAVVVFLVAGSDILTLAFVPLALVRLFRRAPDGRRDRHGMLLVGLYALGLAAQVGGLLSGTSTRSVSTDPVTAASGYVSRAVPWGLLGEHLVGPTGTGRWTVLAAAAWLIIALCAVLALARWTRPRWAFAVVAALHSAAIYALPVVLSGYATARYAVPAAMLLVTALVAVLLPAGTNASVNFVRSAAPLYAMAALLAVVWMADLRVDNSRAHGPVWSDELQTARQKCVAGNATTSLPIPPRDSGTRWNAVLPCDYVSR
jgi:hypothetical protein